MFYSGIDNIMFTVFPIIFFAGFMAILCVIIAAFVRGATQWKRNNESPVLTVNAVVVTKRSGTRHVHNRTGAHHHISTTHYTYFATFEVESGDRLELEIRDTEFGLLAERDAGRLTFQGTRYLGFERDRRL